MALARSSAAGASWCAATTAFHPYSSATSRTQLGPVYARARSTKSATRKTTSSPGQHRAHQDQVAPEQVPQQKTAHQATSPRRVRRTKSQVPNAPKTRFGAMPASQGASRPAVPRFSKLRSTR